MLKNSEFDKLVEFFDNNPPATPPQAWLFVEALFAKGMYERATKVLKVWEDRIDDPEDRLELAYHQSRVFFIQNRIDEAISTLTQLLRSEDPPESNTIQERKIWVELGRCYWRKGMPERAQKILNAMVRQVDPINDATNYAHCYHILGQVAWSQGSLGTALQYYNEALAIWEEQGASQKMASTLNNIAAIYTTQAQFKKAYELFQQVRDLFTPSNNPLMLGVINVNIGTILFRQGERERAIEVYNAALDQFECADMSHYKAGTIVCMARVMADLGTLSSDHPIIQRFPADPNVGAFKSMLEALLAQREGNWGIASDKWTEALRSGSLDFNFLLVAYEGMTEAAFTRWRARQSKETEQNLARYLEEWEGLAITNNLPADIVKTKLLRAKLAMVDLQFVSAQKLLNEALSISVDNNLPKHHRLVKLELVNVNKQMTQVFSSKAHRQRFEELQLEKFRAYLREIGKVLGEEEKE